MSEKEKRTTRREILRTGLVATVGLSLGCGGGAEPGDAGMIDDDDGGSPDSDGGNTDGGREIDAGMIEQVPAPESVTEDTTAFPLGVASGDATQTSAIFWTSYAGSSAIELVVWEM